MSARRMPASTRASNRISTIEMAVYTSVFFSARQNTGSSNARRKLRNPTQSNDGSPAVTSERAKPMARKNGIPTRATM